MIELQFKFDINDLDLFLKPNNPLFVSEIDNAIKKIAFDIRNTAISNISGGARSGRLYKRRSITHQASAPGEYPKSDTGRLVASVRTDFRYLEADIGSDLDYSKYLEDGTSKMKPRKWLQPSAEANQDKWLGYIETALKRTFKL